VDTRRLQRAAHTRLAISMAMARTWRLPAFDIPRSHSCCPLSFGIGVSPTIAPTSRRLRSSRQPNSSIM
jgi:hypothetical protein